jgi:hypothetical protein
MVESNLRIQKIGSLARFNELDPRFGPLILAALRCAI